MQYFELDRLYNTVPTWAAAVLDLGYRWRSGNSNSRRIGLLSMPYESEAAGLIALGALRSDLERPSANHVDTHFEILQRSYREHLAPDSDRETSSGDSRWDVWKASDYTRWRFAPYEGDNDVIALELATHRPVVKRKGKRVPNPHGACTSYILRSNAIEWQLRDCPLPELPQDGTALEVSAYRDLPGCTGPIHEANLRRSYDGLVLIGHGAARESKYMQKLYKVGFASGDRRLPLGELLTLHSSEQKYIQRLRFLNERVQHDASGHPAWLVIADGVSALLCAEKLFPSSDIIGVCNRNAPAEAVLQLKDWLNHIVRYYRDTESSEALTGKIPAGMLLRVLQRRT